MDRGSAHGSSRSFTRGRWNIAHKITATTVLTSSICLALVVLSVLYITGTQLRVVSQHHYEEMTRALASELAGAVRWRNEWQIEKIYNQHVSYEDPILHGLSISSASTVSKEPLHFVRQVPEVNDPALDALFTQSESDEPLSEPVDTGESLVFRVPVILGEQNLQVGWLTAAWDMHGTRMIQASVIKASVLVSVVLFSICAALMYLFAKRTVARPLRRNVAIANRIAAGDLSNDIEVSGSDELGELDFALSAMQGALRASDDSERRAAESGRIREALDAASSATMLTDQNDRIVYINASGKRLLQTNAKVFAAGQLNPANILGQSISGLSRIEGLDLSSLGKQGGQSVQEFSVAGRTLKVSISPVSDARQQRIGTVFEWQDRTDEVSAEQQLRSMVDAAAGGDFSKRIDDAGMGGFHAQVASMLNALAEISEDGLNDVLRVLRGLAAGDLSVRIEKHYDGLFGELKESCNTTSDKIREIVGRIREAAVEVSQGASEISRGNLELASRTDEQASSLERTASAMEEMTATVKQNSENANKANRLSDDAHQRAVHGGEVANRAVSAVSEISEASRKIADINGVIDEIAFQTNLLALNASVEAARAGELGRGFAVVASEVRNLAGRSAQAAREIKELIEDSVSKVAEGERLVEESGQALNAIVSSVKQVSDIVDEIALASNEQAAGIGQINISVAQIDETTQQNSALVEQAAAASRTVGDQAKELDELMNFFKLDSAGNRPVAGVTPLPAAPVQLPAAPLSPPASKAVPQSDTYDGPERRRAERPWSTPAPAPAAPPASGVYEAASGDDTEWEEF
ncbi:methyl-accepting chemotaxis protein [Granulosicoccaceae sp. 1_MG-2023]|nr:methyl-accepting chemotaxis protein [Granulosicoccaceae sp. 1_MG-2023]